METSIETSPVRNWLKKMMASTKKHNPYDQPSLDVFGVPLVQSLQIANTPIAYESKEIVIGLIPIIVAKCGSFLKDQGLYVEGVFRKSGSARRIGELQQLFNSSSDHGIGFNWVGFNVHDAANCLRRFLNYLPEPVIPSSFYASFRNISTKSDTVDITMRVKEYQYLIDQLPKINQHLLFYLLDLLALFSRYEEYTKMNSVSLASVFTPGILLHPDHAMHPDQYKQSQKVVQFLIEYQDHFRLPKCQQSAPSKLNLYPTYHSREKQLLRANTVPVLKHRMEPNYELLQVIRNC
ncbi:Rho-GTPase-activating protein 5 [Choanephora cucurbitarum]|uniref:Rho-GTPase-activating protein 5 n=1 Tax=Choanephora cucurbitarum TaxID=101091 RepID=A0A1C7NLB0_9FUNG|nr:Rho-GTPase-activating protein 5 [Choanephora cucurbitarum]